MDASREWQLNCPEAFVYEASQSRTIIFGVDFTPPAAANGASHCGFRLRQAEKDATFIASAVRERMIGCDATSDQVQICTISSDYDKCTVAGMEKVFDEQLKLVGKEGAFVFMFVGSATSCSGNYSLNLVDFDVSNTATHVTPDTIIKWLSKLSSLPNHIVFIFSCPFANKLAEGMANATKYQSFGDQPGILLKKCFTKVGQCCEALSSLVVTYRNDELKSNIMESITTYLKVDPRIEVDGSDVGRFEFLTKHVDRKKRRVVLHPKVDAFLEYAGEYALCTLNENKVLADDNVLLTSFCVLMFSVASFQAAEDKESIQQPSLFVQAFIRVAGTIEAIYKDPKADNAEFYVNMFKKSVDFYLQVLKENNIKDKKLQEYLHKVNADIAHIA